MLKITKEIKNLEKIIFDSEKNLKTLQENSAESELLKNRIANARALLVEFNAIRERTHKERHKIYMSNKKKDADFMEQKRNRANKGRTRKHYYAKTDKSHDKSFKSVNALLSYYREHPHETYYYTIKYSGNKIIDGVRIREFPLTTKDILMLG